MPIISPLILNTPTWLMINMYMIQPCKNNIFVIIFLMKYSWQFVIKKKISTCVWTRLINQRKCFLYGDLHVNIISLENIQWFSSCIHCNDKVQINDNCERMGETGLKNWGRSRCWRSVIIFLGYWSPNSDVVLLIIEWIL